VSKAVLVVIGTGGMGLSIARRCGSGKVVLLADYSQEALAAATETLQGEGHAVEALRTDVSSRADVAALADAAASLGHVHQVAHTAGLSPAQATTEAILRVDLLGTAVVLDEFAPVVASGGAGVVIASMAGHMAANFPPDQESLLANTPTDELLDLPFLAADVVHDPGLAYGMAKRANHLRVRAASCVWGDAGARLNSISPGIISTPMGQQELASPQGQIMRALLAASCTGRLGTPDDIAAAAAFLLGPDASFITGTDLLVDGGAVAGLHGGRLQL
jgi:NAD(P)-dependent dehydrogenase (short-subunit alcohol dehydrogenase family)